MPEVATGTRGSHAHAHLVQFYETDAFLVASVREHVLAALQGSDAAVVIATPAHCDALRALLRDEIDIASLEATGRLRLLDASGTLDSFMVDGHPDPARFRDVVGSIVASAAGDGRHVHAFGEMVALLWAGGNVVAALEVEELWNDLAKTHRFTLLCAYPLTAFEADPDTSAFDAMCGSHASILPAERHPILTRSLNRLRVLDRTRNEFIAMVVHDIRTPTIVIGEFLKILRDNWASMPEEQIRDLLDRSIDNTAQINQLVSDILTTARLESREFTFERASFDLAEVVYRAVGAVRDVAPRTTFEVQIDPNLPAAFGDEARQMQILNNLLTNAVKFGDGDVTVTARLSGNEITVSVSDQGEGIASHDASKLFKRFARLHGPKHRHVKGTGLGLYICKALVEGQGGRIWLEPDGDSGATFSYTVPIAPSR